MKNRKYLINAEVLELRKLYKYGVSCANLAAHFGLSLNGAWQIARGKRRNGRWRLKIDPIAKGEK